MKEDRTSPQHSQSQLEKHNISDRSLLHSTAKERQRIAEECSVHIDAVTAHYQLLVQFEKDMSNYRRNGRNNLMVDPILGED